MKYIKFNKSHVVEDINGGWVVLDNGEALTVPFEVFLKSIILVDDRWGKSGKLLNNLMDIRDKVKSLSFNDAVDGDKILELTDEEWQMCVIIAEEPQTGFNVQFANALFQHIKDLKEAPSVQLKV